MITIGRIVHYVLSNQDAETINILNSPGISAPLGYSSFQGNPAFGGQICPAIVVATFNAPVQTVNLQVFLDGNGSFWAASRHEGDGCGTWHWPDRGAK